MATRARDTQKSKVYAWENKEFPLHKTGSLSLESCAELANQASVLFGDRRFPEIRDGRGRRSGCGDGFGISLPKFARNVSYVLHEVAHYIQVRHRWDGAWHGPRWLGAYLYLLSRFTARSYADLVASAREFGLTVREVLEIEVAP